MFNFKHSLHAATAALALLGAASVGIAADTKPTDCKSADCKSMHMMPHHDVAILSLVEKAQTSADHEAVAKRYEDEAANYEKQAAEHEKLATQYRKAPSNPKWNNNSAALAVHCDNQAKRLKAAAAEARDMAQLHGDVAKLTIPQTK